MRDDVRGRTVGGDELGRELDGEEEEGEVSRGCGPEVVLLGEDMAEEDKKGDESARG